jgi:hypothetical protein
MTQRWGSTPLVKLLTGDLPWALTLDGDRFEIMLADSAIAGHVFELEHMSVLESFFWAKVRFRDAEGKGIDLGGIANVEARKLIEAVKKAIAHAKQQERVAEFLSALPAQMQIVGAWVRQVQRAIEHQLQYRGWLDGEFVTSLEGTRPTELERFLAFEGAEQHLGRLSEQEKQVLHFWRQPLMDLASAQNEQPLQSELVSTKGSEAVDQCTGCK